MTSRVEVSGPRMPAYLSPEWFRWYTPLHGDACDYARMVRIMRLREMARYGTSDTQEWARLTNKAEQLLTDRQFPRSA